MQFHVLCLSWLCNIQNAITAEGPIVFLFFFFSCCSAEGSCHPWLNSDHLFRCCRRAKVADAASEGGRIMLQWGLELHLGIMGSLSKEEKTKEGKKHMQTLADYNSFFFFKFSHWVINAQSIVFRSLSAVKTIAVVSCWSILGPWHFINWQILCK